MATRSYATNSPTQAEVDAYAASKPYGGLAPSYLAKYGASTPEEAMAKALSASNATPGLRREANESMLASGGTGSDVINRVGSALPNYTGAPTMNVQNVPTAPARQGFVDIDPLTGKPKMLPYTPGMGAGIFNQVINDPNRIRNLMGGATGRAPGVGPTPLGGGGAVGGPIDAAGGGAVGNPATAVGPGGELPNYVLNQAAGNLSSALRGELPEDVQNLLQQQAAEYGVGSGTQGSQFAGYRGLRNLGLTSLDRMREAEKLVAGQFTKPAEKLALDQKERELADLRARADRAFGLDKQKLEAELQLEKDKFAAYQNELNRKYEQDILKSLNTTYPNVGGGIFGAPPVRTRFYGGENGPGPLQRLF